MTRLAAHWDAVRLALSEEKRRVSGVMRVDEVAFLPAALEIAERPVSPTGRLTAWILLLGLAVTIAWLSLGKVDVVASAPGKLAPIGSVRVVQAAEAGIVRAIHVRDGQVVRKGELLIELDPTISGAETEQARAALLTAELDAARARYVLARLNGRTDELVAPVGTPTMLVATQRQLAEAELASARALASGGTAATRAAGAALNEAAVQAAKLAETLPLIDEQIAANEALLAKGYVSKLRVIEMRRQRLIAARDRDAALQLVARAEADVDGTGSGGARNLAEARVKVLGDLAKASGEILLRREELTKSVQRTTLQRLVATVDGTVAQLSVHTIGGVIDTGRLLMTIVPSTEPLVLDARVANKDVGFVQIGQAVAVKLEAFPFTRYGTIAGQVVALGSDAVEDERFGLAYPVKIKLHANQINRGDRVVRLAAGMVATADIRTGRRTVLTYLTSPIAQAVLSSARER